MNSSAAIRAHVFYRGRVQGVGFRWTCKELSGGRAVGGFVKNLPDGRVELAAEGRPADVREFLDAIAQAMTGKIDDASRVDTPLNGPPEATFEIRH